MDGQLKIGPAFVEVRDQRGIELRTNGCSVRRQLRWHAETVARHAAPAAGTRNGAMSGTQEEKKAEDEERDEALEETFPASDPVAIGGTTGPEDTKPA
jgi:hypothetical protein